MAAENGDIRIRRWTCDCSWSSRRGGRGLQLGRADGHRKADDMESWTSSATSLCGEQPLSESYFLFEEHRGVSKYIAFKTSHNSPLALFYFPQKLC